jgi:hypothetical protein
MLLLTFDGPLRAGDMLVYFYSPVGKAGYDNTIRQDYLRRPPARVFSKTCFVLK